VFVVDDRVGRFRVDERMKVLYPGAADAAQGDAIRLPVTVFVPAPDTAARTMPQMEFRVATRACDPETFVVSVHGDVDPVTAPELERELLEAVQLGARRVVVDLTETASFDSSAIHALLRSGEQLEASGLQLDVVRGNPSIKKVFAITATDRALPTHGTVEQAVSVTGNARRASNVRGRFTAQVRQQRQALLHLGAGLRRRVPKSVSAGHETALAD
jgi:anti-sigma B factor antagonist